MKFHPNLEMHNLRKIKLNEFFFFFGGGVWGGKRVNDFGVSQYI